MDFDLYYFVKKTQNLICSRKKKYKMIWSLIYTWILTYAIYMCYHIARKPISVVKTVLNENCSTIDPGHNDSDIYWCDWEPFNTKESSTLLGALDSAYLFAYAFGMLFLSGVIAERMNLNLFLFGGMVMSGLFTILFGLGYTFNIHQYWYYLIVQIFGGLFLSTGWPAVVTVMGNWFGKSKRGLIMGIWNSHTSVGNIFGTLIAGAFLDTRWDLSFIIPGLIIAGLGIFSLFFLVPHPNITGMTTNDHIETPQTDDDIECGETERLLESDSQEDTTPIDPPESVTVNRKNEKPISLLNALRIPGVVEFAASLFFSKLVSYTFLFWLPHFILDTGETAEDSANQSTLFDVGGIVGGILAGVLNDVTLMPASTCSVMLIAAIPMLFIYQSVAQAGSHGLSLVLLVILGLLVNGPYALITTAVSADLGTHPMLIGNSKALSTVTSIIDGTGSFGAAIGPLLAGALTGGDDGNWGSVFIMLMVSDFFSLLLLLRLVYKEVTSLNRCCFRRVSSDGDGEE